VVVDRDRYPDGAGGLQQREGARAVRILDGQGDGARACERADDQVQALGDAAGHHQLLGGDLGGAHPAQVGRQLGTHLGDAGGIAVPQRLVRRRLHDVTDRAQPRLAREGGQVRRADA
jgi:hypothetical protein